MIIMFPIYLFMTMCMFYCAVINFFMLTLSFYNKWIVCYVLCNLKIMYTALIVYLV